MTHFTVTESTHRLSPARCGDISGRHQRTMLTSASVRAGQWALAAAQRVSGPAALGDPSHLPRSWVLSHALTHGSAVSGSHWPLWTSETSWLLTPQLGRPVMTFTRGICGRIGEGWSAGEQSRTPPGSPRITFARRLFHKLAGRRTVQQAGSRAGVRGSPVGDLRRLYFYGRFGALHRLVTDLHDSASVMDLVCRLVSTVFERTTQGTGHGSPCRFCYVIVESARSSVSGESTRGNCSVCRGRCVGITCSPVHRFTGSLKHSVWQFLRALAVLCPFCSVLNSQQRTRWPLRRTETGLATERITSPPPDSEGRGLHHRTGRDEASRSDRGRGLTAARTWPAAAPPPAPAAAAPAAAPRAASCRQLRYAASRLGAHLEPETGFGQLAAATVGNGKLVRVCEKYTDELK